MYLLLMKLPPLKNLQIYALPVIFFGFTFVLGLCYQVAIFCAFDYPFTARSLQAFWFGLCRYAQVSAILSLLPLSLFFLKFSWQKIFVQVLAIAYFVFLYIDWRYSLQFSTHLPFSTLQYLSISETQQSMLDEILKIDFVFFFVLPTLILFVFLYFLKPRFSILGWQKKLRFVVQTFLLLFLIGIIPATYVNSYLGKSKQDLLTTNAVLYFFDSKNIILNKIVEKPNNELQTIQNYLSSISRDEFLDSDYPLVRKLTNNSCQQEKKNSLGQSLCNLYTKPNIIFVMLESFRAADIGIYGGKLPLTPNFDKLAKQGILFRNFFANGFQTKHGEIASFCSAMPNYGRAALAGYPKNDYLCLSQVLKGQGYQTSFFHNGDLAFDNQYSFLKKNHFQIIFDKFSFPKNTEKLGWGYSDEALFRHWEQELDKIKEPFFTVGLTLTSHHPYDVPEKYSLALKRLNLGKSNQAKFFESLFYLDSQLGKFIQNISQKKWYKNTLVFIFADTSHFIESQKQPQNFAETVVLHSQIPLLILGEKLNTKEIISYASQLDLAPTVADILGLSINSPWIGTSLLKPQTHSFAYTNRPAGYWASLSKNGSLILLEDKKILTTGKLSKEKKEELIDLSNSWITSQRWLLQNNYIWNNKFVED